MLMDSSIPVGQALPSLVYHYTSLEKFKCILKYGTLRFKMSTQSNDMVDTKHFVDLIKRINFKLPDSEEETSKLISMLLGYFKRDDYKSNHKSFVACFTGVPDSRLLWDAYTINRPSNIQCEFGKDKYCYSDLPKYNGVCIGLKTNVLIEVLKNVKTQGICQNGYIAPIFYTEEQHVLVIDYLASQAKDIYQQLKDDPDQSQTLIPTIPFSYSLDFDGYRTKPRGFVFDLKKSFVASMMNFISSIETISPFIKHPFWQEENEFRASLLLPNAMAVSVNAIMSDGISEFIDVEVPISMIDNIILGPEFSEMDKKELLELSNAKIKFEELSCKPSIGTGVIRMN